MCCHAGDSCTAALSTNAQSESLRDEEPQQDIRLGIYPGEGGRERRAPSAALTQRAAGDLTTSAITSACMGGTCISCSQDPLGSTQPVSESPSQSAGPCICRVMIVLLSTFRVPSTQWLTTCHALLRPVWSTCESLPPGTVPAAGGLVHCGSEWPEVAMVLLFSARAALISSLLPRLLGTSAIWRATWTSALCVLLWRNREGWDTAWGVLAVRLSARLLEPMCVPLWCTGKGAYYVGV